MCLFLMVALSAQTRCQIENYSTGSHQITGYFLLNFENKILLLSSLFNHFYNLAGANFCMLGCKTE